MSNPIAHRFAQARAASKLSPLLFLAALWIYLSGGAWAQTADQSIIKGPASVPLGDNLATINLPSGYGFVKKDVAQKVLEQNGSQAKNVLGLLLPANVQENGNNFAVIVSFDDCGYVSDSDAGKLNADDILNSYKESVKQQNERRQKLKLPPVYVGGWAETPRYEKGAHQVIWALDVKHQDTPGAPVVAVNYNTRVLGRRGVLSLNLLTKPDLLAGNKPKLAVLLDDTTFNQGQSYGDYKPGTDKAAGFGIAGLILGGGALAAAKFGLLGGLGKWIIGIVLVLKKFIVVGIAAVAAFIARFFKRNKPTQP